MDAKPPHFQTTRSIHAARIFHASATSPGGADSVAIIAAASRVDLPFVMAMQTARFLLVMLAGPSLAKMVARWAAS